MEENKLVALAVKRQEAMTCFEDLTDDLRAAIVAGVNAGELSELRAARLTGLSRTTVRAWLGKT